MSTTYIVTTGEYSDYSIYGVYTEKDTADFVCEILNNYGIGNARVEEHAIDVIDDNIHNIYNIALKYLGNKNFYIISILDKTGEVNCRYKGSKKFNIPNFSEDAVLALLDEINSVFYIRDYSSFHGDLSQYQILVLGEDFEEAKKIGSDKIFENKYKGNFEELNFSLQDYLSRTLMEKVHGVKLPER